MYEEKETQRQSFRRQSDLLRLLGHPTRLALLVELMKGPKCVNDIRELLDVQQANASQHLAVLRREGIIDYYEDGRRRCYYIVRPGLVESLIGFIGGDYPAVHRSAAWVREAARKLASFRTVRRLPSLT